MITHYNIPRVKALNKRDTSDNIDFSPELGKRAFRNAKYDTSDFIVLRQLITPEFVREFEIPRKTRELINPNKASYHGMADMARNVFCKFINIMIEQAIEHNYTFKVPGVDSQYIGICKKSSLQMKGILSPECKVYKNVDLIKTDFNIYQFFYRSEANNTFKEIRVNHSNYTRIVEKANTGTVYRPLIDKKMEDYIEPLYKEFPHFSEKQIKKIVICGFTSIGRSIAYGKNIFIKNTRLDTYLVIYDNTYTEKSHKEDVLM